MFYNLRLTYRGAFCWLFGHGWSADITAGGRAYMECRTCHEVVWLDA